MRKLIPSIRSQHLVGREETETSAPEVDVTHGAHGFLIRPSTTHVKTGVSPVVKARKCWSRSWWLLRDVIERKSQDSEGGISVRSDDSGHD